MILVLLVISLLILILSSITLFRERVLDEERPHDWFLYFVEQRINLHFKEAICLNGFISPLGCLYIDDMDERLSNQNYLITVLIALYDDSRDFQCLIDELTIRSANEVSNKIIKDIEIYKDKQYNLSNQL
jgi:hypothetical protein